MDDKGMTHTNPLTRYAGVLAGLPAGPRLMLTAFLALIGFGYLIAVANIFSHHANADGNDGLSIDDLRVVYSGMDVPAGAGAEVPSRMLTMLRGEMRQYASSEAHFTVLEGWLAKGAPEAGLEQGEGKITPRRVLILDCMRCHALSTGTEIAKQAPFGPDEFTPDSAMLVRFTAPAKSKSPGVVRAAPQYTLPRLILISHQHMLAIPMFTLAVAILFMLSRVPARWKNALTPLPMIILVFDFSGWWLARVAEPFVYVIAAAGGLFSAVLGFQIIAAAVDLWRGPPRGGPGMSGGGAGGAAS